MNCDQEQRAALTEAQQRNQAKAQALLERLKHIRRVDPELPIALVAKRLEVSKERVRAMERELGLAPAPKSEGLQATFSTRTQESRRRRRAVGRMR